MYESPEADERQQQRAREIQRKNTRNPEAINTKYKEHENNKEHEKYKDIIERMNRTHTKGVKQKHAYYVCIHIYIYM